MRINKQTRNQFLMFGDFCNDDLWWEWVAKEEMENTIILKADSFLLHRKSLSDTLWWSGSPAYLVNSSNSGKPEQQWMFVILCCAFSDLFHWNVSYSSMLLACCLTSSLICLLPGSIRCMSSLELTTLWQDSYVRLSHNVALSLLSLCGVQTAWLGSQCLWHSILSEFKFWDLFNATRLNTTA